LRASSGSLLLLEVLDLRQLAVDAVDDALGVARPENPCG
jgi:hypothetical protein